jgi:chaperonin cofactor prefoldin
LRHILNEKEKAVKELGDVIKIFEMKLEGANNFIKKLEEKVNNLTEKIRSKGYNV